MHLNLIESRAAFLGGRLLDDIRIVVPLAAALRGIGA